MAETAGRSAFGGQDQQARELRREVPHSVDLERAVLAVLLEGRNPTDIHKVREHLEHPLSFFVRNHQLIFQACLDVDDQGERVDAQGVAELLRRTGFQVAIDRLRQQQLLLDSSQLDGMSRSQLRALYRFRREDQAEAFQDSALAAVGGYAALAEISSSFTTSAGLQRNAALLRDYYLKRRLIQHLGRIADSAHRTTDGFPSLLDQSSQTLLALGRHSEGREVHDMAAVVDETIGHIAERNANPEEGVLTGYDELDDMLMSLRSGGLYVLAARPGVGKTSFALSLVQNICSGERPHSALFFSLEVDRVDLIKKLLCGRAEIDFKDLERGLIDEEEFRHLEQVAEEIKSWSLDLMDVSDLTVQALRSVVKRHMLEPGKEIKLIVIDYLQLLSSARGDQSEYEKISEISRTLKILARELGVPVLALSQMSRESERAAGKPREPRLSDLRGSGSIEQDADAVLFLHRSDPDDEQRAAIEGRDIKLLVAKNRFGPTGAVGLRFFPGRQRFAAAPTNELGGYGPANERRERLERAPGGDEDLFA